MLRKTSMRIEKVRRKIEKAGCITSSATLMFSLLIFANPSSIYTQHFLFLESCPTPPHGPPSGRTPRRPPSAAAPGRLPHRSADHKKMPLGCPNAEVFKFTRDKLTALMRKAFGQPMRSSRGRLYHIHCAEKTLAGITPQGFPYRDNHPWKEIPVAHQFNN